MPTAARAELFLRRCLWPNAAQSSAGDHAPSELRDLDPDRAHDIATSDLVADTESAEGCVQWLGARQMLLELHEPSVGDLTTAWLRDFYALVEAGQRARRTLVSYEKAARFGAMRWFPSTPAGALTVREVVQMQRELGDDAARGPAIANQAVYAIRAAYGYAARTGLWEGPCPADKVRPLATRTRKFPVEADAANRVCDFCWDAFLRPKHRRGVVLDEVRAAYFLVLFGTGIRRSEGTHLRHEEYDPRARTLTITHHKTSKRHGAKVLPCNEPTCTVLEEIAMRRWHAVLMFPSPRSKRGHIEDPWRAWKRVLRHLELDERTRIHDIRHGFAASAYAACRDLKAVQGLLGHASVATTSHYVGRPPTATTMPVSERAAALFMGAVPKGGSR